MTKGEIKVSEKKLRQYETTYIIRPNLDEEGVDKTIAAVDEFIKNQGGVVEMTDKKGRKRLSYEVDKMRDGFYVNTLFKAPPEAIVPLKRMMTLSEDIIRELTIFLPKEALNQQPVPASSGSASA